jgi:phage shock protein C
MNVEKTHYTEQNREQSTAQGEKRNMQAKRLVRSRKERLVAGVGGGLANYFNIDPLLVRLGLLILSMFQGLGILIYMILWFLVPNEDSQTVDSRGQIQENVGEMREYVQQFARWVRGLFNR